MFVQKTWKDARENARVLAFDFGMGAIFSLIVVYFIFLYSRDKGWALLAFISKWYLIIAGGLIALSLGIILLIILFSLLMLLIAMIRLKTINKGYKNKKDKEYIDVDYRVEE